MKTLFVLLLTMSSYAEQKSAEPKAKPTQQKSVQKLVMRKPACQNCQRLESLLTSYKAQRSLAARRQSMDALFTELQSILNDATLNNAAGLEVKIANVVDVLFTIHGDDTFENATPQAVGRFYTSHRNEFTHYFNTQRAGFTNADRIEYDRLVNIARSMLRNASDGYNNN